MSDVLYVFTFVLLGLFAVICIMNMGDMIAESIRQRSVAGVLSSILIWFAFGFGPIFIPGVLIWAEGVLWPILYYVAVIGCCLAIWKKGRWSS